MEFEYCVMHEASPNDPHRGPWSEQKCRDWIKEWKDDGGRRGAFYIARRVIGPWHKAF